jgi:hypothetical protein
LTGLALLLASCATPATEVAVVAPESDSRVTVNLSKKTTADAVETDGGIRLVITGHPDERWTGGFGAYMRTLSTTSCPVGTRMAGGESIGITASPVQLQPLNPGRRRLGDLTFVAGYQLTSPDKRFGGLSGIELLENGNLLGVSDHNEFVWIDLASDGVTPVSARIAGMSDMDGAGLDAEVDGRAEGIAWNSGMALVSFDDNNQVLAYDIGKCGAAARGAPIVFGPFGMSLAEAYGESRISVADGAGSEALAVTNDWYLFTGVETKVGQLSPMSARPIEQDPDFSLRVGVEAEQFVGLDLLPVPKRQGSVRAFTLHRSFSPRSGYGVTIAETDFNRYTDDKMTIRHIDGDIDQRARNRFVETGWRKLAEMDMLMTIDNFEGIAAKELPDGRTRLFVISDDNFSATQRTLLMVFDLPKPLR